MEIFSCSNDNNSPLYLKRDGKIYTLPVDKYTLNQLEKEVIKNKGEYMGIIKNASGNINIKLAAPDEEQSYQFKDGKNFKVASQALQDNANHNIS